MATSHTNGSSTAGALRRPLRGHWLAAGRVGAWVLLLLLLLVVVVPGCHRDPGPPPADWELTCAWADVTLRLTRFTPANSPTYASRCLGYAGLTMYLSAAEDAAPLVASLNGLPALPTRGEGVRAALALNAGQAEILRRLYAQTSTENLGRVDSLEAAMAARLAGPDRAVDDASRAYGRAVAEHVARWAEGDGGHRAYLANFDKAWVHPTHAGHWEPPLFAQSFSHHPLHPRWGENRPFLPADTALPMPPPPAYDTTPGSPYYEEFRAVYVRERALGAEDKRIALWWGDDPDETVTPPGHSYAIARLAVAAHHADLERGAETFARVGMAVADAFIHCWRMKFHFFTERPNTFINRHLDPGWESFWPDPPFPAYPSGHAIQAAAAARVLEGVYGLTFAFVDSAHAGSARDAVRGVDFVPRRYAGFWDAAVETADSRFYGGIHTPTDNATGLALGERIAANVNGLPW